jgi:hypothetical protein
MIIYNLSTSLDFYDAYAHCISDITYQLFQNPTLSTYILKAIIGQDGYSNIIAIGM